jgi:hypothetical protein
MFLHDDKWHDPDVATWMYRLMNDPEYYERWFYKDAMDDYNMIIAECQKMYDMTPVPSRLVRSRLRSTIKRAERDLAKVQAEYDKFKRYKQRTQISE